MYSHEKNRGPGNFISVCLAGFERKDASLIVFYFHLNQAGRPLARMQKYETAFLQS